MVEYKPPRSVPKTLLDRRWVGGVYATFALALLVLASLQRAESLVRIPIALFLLLVLLIATPLTAALIGRGRSSRWFHTAVPILIIDAIAALALIGVTGGYASPLWIGLLVASTAAPLLLPGRWSATLLTAIWLIDGLFLLNAPPELIVEASLIWAVRVTGVALIALVLQRALVAEEERRMRAQRREQVLHEFLVLSNKLRVNSQPSSILEAIASAVQASGEFDCVTLSRVDEHASRIEISLAIGASGRRLKAVESLTIPWQHVRDLLSEQRRAGPGSFRVEALPFRSLRDEQHLIMPLTSQFGGVQGLLTVSCAAAQRAALDEALPLLELLANQAAAVLDNSSLYATLEQRVQSATSEITRSKHEVALARDRAEMLYQIVRTLARSLDEREVLAEALALIQQATEAQGGGIMLVEPNTGRLAVRTGLEDEKEQGGDLERLQALGGVVLAHRDVLIVADTHEDMIWRSYGRGYTVRSVLAVPLLLDNEPMGVLVLIHNTPHHFQLDHSQVALAAAGQIAVALSKAQIYRYASEQSEQLSITLQQREEEVGRVRAILSSIGDGVVVCDRLDRVRLMNPAAEEILAISAKQVVGRLMSDLPGVPLTSDRTGHVTPQQFTLGKRTLRSHYAPILSAAGEQLGGVVVYHDITRDALADKLKSNFIATASHELRTPLTSIRGYVDLLLLGTIGPVTKPQSDFLKVVKHNVVQLVELINDILDVSKIEAGEVRLRRAPTDIAEIICEVGEALYSQFTERSIALALNVPDDLPQVMADRQRVRQVVVNLVGNACKYTPVGGRVDVMVYVADHELRVDVRDTGVGIASESQEHIFTPFYRADNPLRDVVGGTGLGLSITKTLVELHGGRIWFDSCEGRGTTFSFTLPLEGYEWTPVAWLEEKTLA